MCMEYYELTPDSSCYYTDESIWYMSEFTLNSTSQSILLTDIIHPVSFGPDLVFNNGYTEHVSLIYNLFSDQDDSPNLALSQSDNIALSERSNVACTGHVFVQSIGKILPVQPKCQFLTVI